jgi:flagellar basal body-associated protein FliL
VQIPRLLEPHIMGRKGMIAVILVALLFGGGAVASFILGTSLDAPKEEVVEELVEPGKVAFVKMPPVSVPLVRREEVYRFMQLTVSLEVPEGVSLDNVRRQIPRLHDAFIHEINSRSVMRKDGSGVIDLERVKLRLLARARRLLGQDQVNDVLLGSAAG